MKPYLSLIILLLPMAITAQKAGGKHVKQLVIDGSLEQMTQAIPFVYIVLLDGDTGGRDSVPVINGRYRFVVNTSVSSLITLTARNPLADTLIDRDLITFFSEPAKVSVVSTGTFSKATITGSKADIAYHKLEQQREPYSLAISRIYGMMYSVKDEDSVAAFHQSIDSVRLAMSEMYYRFIQSNRSSPLVPYALNMFASGLSSDPGNAKVQQLESAYSRLSATQKSAYYGKNVLRRLNNYRIAIGMKAPAFTQQDTAGNAVSLASFKGKYVLLDFWASWCVPCREENPAVVEAFKKYSDKNFTVLSISLDRPGARDKWLQAIRKDGLDWTNLSDLRFWDNKVAKLYHVQSIPQNFLIDPQGNIIAKGLRGAALERKLKSIL